MILEKDRLYSHSALSGYFKVLDTNDDGTHDVFWFTKRGTFQALDRITPTPKFLEGAYEYDNTTRKKPCDTQHQRVHVLPARPQGNAQGSHVDSQTRTKLFETFPE